ncbi:hypothetical protein CYMTET_25091 [Cymbomonas tetramitiformis]|uniref:tRNA/rRNA methyltransferase SpoU type domain-containing protein n=1 Tax=Cymbomonas tetramitiformis TaxID=36881 RepID=A0AAE0FUS2_9CHLO|nr:hypothetical protein CYMTET_25091 [Cymbomonas tetramitiformis]
MYTHMTWEDLGDLAAMRNLQMVAAHPAAAPQTLDSFGPGGERSEENVCLVLGSEGQGLSATAMEEGYSEMVGAAMEAARKVADGGDITPDANAHLRSASN